MAILVRTSRWQVLAAMAALWTGLAVAQAQQAQPRIGYVCPAGGQQGATFEVTIGGEHLSDKVRVLTTGEGIKATVVEYVKPMNRKQFMDLLDEFKELAQRRRAAQGTPERPNRPTSRPASRPAGKQGAARAGNQASQPTTSAAWTEQDEKTFLEIERKLAEYINRPQSPAIAESLVLQVTVAADASPGRREIRVTGPDGLSNPLVFYVGNLPEVTKKQSKELEDLRKLRVFRNAMPNPPRENFDSPPVAVTLPTVVNGQILAGGVNRYSFHATKGTKLVAAAQARGLVPYIADAVPGWFQAVLTLYDADGHEVQVADHFRAEQDPVLFCEIPKDGDYRLDVRDSLYRGREDFVYRITIGQVPFIRGTFPLGAKAGETASVELTGWNLPSTKLTLDAKDVVAGIYPLDALGKGMAANRASFAIDSLPEVIAKGTNTSQKDAQAVTLPAIVNGRIEHAGDWHVYKFEAAAGDEVVAEVTARRLGSALDSVLKLTDSGGKQLAFNDDFDDKGSGLKTHQADSYLRAKLPAAGTYYVHLADAQQQSGPECGYRLRISRAQPDYELRVTPSGINVRPGLSVPITVYALRKDGFAGAIELSLKDAPAGLTLTGGGIPQGQDQVRLTLSAPVKPMKDPAPIQIVGRAKMQDREVVRAAKPADDMMQAFLYRHLVPAETLAVASVGRGPVRMPVQVADAGPVKIPAGKTAKVAISMPPGLQAANIEFELDGAPDGITIQKPKDDEPPTAIVLECDGAKIKPGLKGNLIVNVVLVQKPPAPAPATQPATAPTTGPTTAPATAPAKAAVKPFAKGRKIQLGTLPAIPFEVVPS